MRISVLGGEACGDGACGEGKGRVTDLCHKKAPVAL